MPKMVHFGEFLKNLKLEVKQSYQTEDRIPSNEKDNVYWNVLKTPKLNLNKYNALFKGIHTKRLP